MQQAALFDNDRQMRRNALQKTQSHPPVTKYEFGRLTSLLNIAELKYRKEHGRNPSMPWSEWGDRPRAGARWNSDEMTALLMRVSEMSTAIPIGDRMGAVHLAELAWWHGRSAVAIRSQLVTELGSLKYYELFKDPT
jgi:hypothetical protein